MPEPRGESMHPRNGHVVMTRPGRGLLSPPVAYCLTCNWTCSGAVGAMQRAIDRHQGMTADIGSRGGVAK